MSNRRIRAVCAVAHSLDTTPSQRYRWEQWQPGLSENGVELEFVSFCTPPMDAALRSGDLKRAALLSALRYPAWLSELATSRQADVVIVPRKAAPAGPVAIEKYLSRGRAAFVYDFDDAVFLEPEGTRSRVRTMLDPASRCETLIKASSLVVAGNSYLAGWARQHNENVVVIPTTVNVEQHRPRPTPKAPGSPVVVGWSGSHSTARYLVERLPLLKKIQESAPFELLVYGAKFDLMGVRGRCVPWSSATEVSTLQEMDIGLMPLENTDWERGKCSLKAILYGAVGIPSVVSNVGTNPDVVIDGKTGFVVNDEDAWKARLGELVRDEKLRAMQGGEARQWITDKFSSQRWTAELATHLRSAANLRSEA